MIVASIVVFHTPDVELRRCIESLSDETVDCVFVIDNSQMESTRLLCQSMSGRGGVPSISYIASDNRGYGTGHNLAIRESMRLGAKYHLVLNSDVTFDRGAVGQIAGHMDDNSRIGALQPRIVNRDGSLQYTVRMLPAPIDLILRRFMPGWMMRRRRERYELRDVDHDVEFNVPYHQGSFMFLRCEALRECGMFDERFFMYPEDIDLTRRIHRRWLTIYYPYVEVVHDHRAASYRDWRMMWIHVVNMIRYFNKWGWFFDSERRRFNRSIRK